MQASRTEKIRRKKPMNKADYTRRERQAERDQKEQYINSKEKDDEIL